jgi:hypothetical protein
MKERGSYGNFGRRYPQESLFRKIYSVIEHKKIYGTKMKLSAVN